MLPILINILIVICLGVCSALFVYFLDFCFNDGNILDFYYNYIKISFKERTPKLFKVLGGCPVCFGFWVCLFYFTLYQFVFDLSPIYFIAYQATCMFTLLKIYKL